MSRLLSPSRARRTFGTAFLVAVLVVGIVPSALGLGVPAAPSRPGSASVSTHGVTALSAGPSAASPASSSEPLAPSSALWTQAWARPSAGSVAPALAPTPLTFGQARALLVANASGFDGGNWSVAFGGGIASPSNSSVPASLATGNCSVTWIATPTTSIFVPATPALSPAGTANFNFFYMVSGNVSDTTLVGTVVNGAASLLFTFETSACAAYSNMVNPVGPQTVDSPVAVATANAAGGSAFLAAHANVTEQWIVIGGQNTSYFVQPPFWSINYSTPCGASFQALVDGLSGILGAASTEGRCTYRVTFNETGLPAGSLWSVTWNNTTNLISTASSLSVVVANGSYSFTVNPEQGYNFTPANGTIIVTGANVSTTIAYTLLPGFYIVWVNETGLPNGTPWSSDLFANYIESTGSSVAYAFANGTYYHVFGAQGYAASPGLGPFTVAGADQTIFVTFHPLWKVTFVETGLPAYTSWSVTFNASGLVGYGTTLSEFIANGTYAWNATVPYGWTAAPPNGSVVVNGANLTVTIAFALAPGYYTVTFVQTGLTTFTYWTVGFTNISSGTFMDFPLTATLPNGSYPFTAYPFSGLFPTPANGTIVVNGSNVLQTIVYAPEVFSVTFTETGLAPGASWSVTVGAQTNTSTGTTATVELANGTYNFTVEAAGYTAVPENGSVVVNGVNVTRSVVFTEVTYTVAFSESGLPPGTSWSVTLGGLTNTSTASYANFTEPNGTYTFTVGAIAGYTASPSTGSITVTGANASRAVTFAVYTYPVTVTETGLLTGQSWSVTMGGVTHASTTTTVTFDEPNGTVSYSIVGVPGFTATPASGTVTVAGAPASAAVVFTLTKYTLTFTETGLPTGTNWSVTANGTVHYATTSTITFTFPNATYAYTVGSVSGYDANRTTSSVTVNGHDTGVAIGFSPSPKATGFLGLPGSEGYYLVGGIVALVIVLAGVGLALRRRHRRRGVATVDDLVGEPPAKSP